LPVLPPNVSLPVIKATEEIPKFLPKKDLAKWYQDFKRQLKQMGGDLTMDDPDKSCYATWSNLLQGNNKRFTSVFTCPLLGERFASGMISGGTYETDFMYYDADEQSLKFKYLFDEEVEDDMRFHKVNFVWYKTKKEAENAAAARAIDCLRFRYPSSHRIADHETTSQMDSDWPRYCKEDPYYAETASELWKTVSNTVKEVFQFEYSKDDILPSHQVWPELPDSLFSDELLKSVFDDEADELMRTYRESRMSNLASIDEED
jgi:hypothetical protein